MTGPSETSLDGPAGMLVAIFRKTGNYERVGPLLSASFSLERLIVE